MRVDLLITEIETGGAERCCVELAIYLARRGVQVRVISVGPAPLGSGEGDARGLLWRRLQGVASELGGGVGRGELEVHFLNASKPWHWFRAKRGLERLLSERRPEVAQGFLWHANVLGGVVYGGAGVNWVAGVRVVEPRRWRAWFGRYWHRPARCVVCVSEEVAAWSARAEGVTLEKLLVIPNGIELPEGEKDWGVGEGGRLIFVGRLEVQKGVDLLLREVERILGALPGYRLELVGDGSWRGAWERWREGSEYGDRVEIMGKRGDIMERMRGADLLLLPTRYEGMPNVVLEAMSVGLPVATMRVEGVSALLGEGLGAQSVEREDWDGWVRLVIDLGLDRGTLQRLGKANRRRVAEHFVLSDQLAKYETLYRELACRS
jgi:glycosyltransferase involved in cell wall biosynthesis